MENGTTLKWWNKLSSAQKTKLCDVNTELVGNVRRWVTLNETEINLLYQEENKSDKEIILYQNKFQ
jgi:hypothetical protein